VLFGTGYLPPRGRENGGSDYNREENWRIVRVGTSVQK
jgi:hypothetical protein